MRGGEAELPSATHTGGEASRPRGVGGCGQCSRGGGWGGGTRRRAAGTAAFSFMCCCSISVGGTSRLRCSSSSAMCALRALAFASFACFSAPAACCAAACLRSSSPDAVSFIRCRSVTVIESSAGAVPTSPWMLFICAEEMTDTPPAVGFPLPPKSVSSTCERRRASCECGVWHETKVWGIGGAAAAPAHLGGLSRASASLVAVAVLLRGHRLRVHLGASRWSLGEVGFSLHNTRAAAQQPELILYMPLACGTVYRHLAVLRWFGGVGGG